jgi:Predicted transcriptional regulators|nr:MAG: transcriptional regulator [Pseudomonadota bacterium]
MEIRTPKALGALIRARRRELKLGQEVLAARVGVSRPWLSAVERGKPTAEIGLLLRTLTALGLTLDVRVEGDAQPDSTAPARPSLPQIDIDEIVDRHRKNRS